MKFSKKKINVNHTSENNAVSLFRLGLFLPFVCAALCSFRRGRPANLIRPLYVEHCLCLGSLLG